MRRTLLVHLPLAGEGCVGLKAGVLMHAVEGEPQAERLHQRGTHGFAPV